MEPTGNLNPYALDYPMCIGEGIESPGATVAHAQRLAMRDHHLRAWRGDAAAESGVRGIYSSVVPKVSAPGSSAPYEPCAEDYTIPLSRFQEIIGLTHLCLLSSAALTRLFLRLVVCVGEREGDRQNVWLRPPQRSPTVPHPSPRYHTSYIAVSNLCDRSPNLRSIFSSIVAPLHRLPLFSNSTSSARRPRYLNRADVQQALRVREGTVWEQCSTQVRYKTTDMLRPMMPYYQRLLRDYDIAVLVFSGVSGMGCFL